jgi:hypothetical protein
MHSNIMYEKHYVCSFSSHLPLVSRKNSLSNLQKGVSLVVKPLSQLELRRLHVFESRQAASATTACVGPASGADRLARGGSEIDLNDRICPLLLR